MNTIHKLAGVQQASDSSPQPAIPVTQPSTTLRPPPIPQDDPDDADYDTNSQGRASLPLNRQPSHKSFRSHHSRRSTASRRGSHEAIGVPADYPPTPRRTQHNGAQPGDIPRTSTGSNSTGSSSADFAWGPSHPCFPHPNPHCIPASVEHARTRVIRVKRDWLAAGDLYPQFANLYPEILDPLVSDAEFRSLVSTLNALLMRSFSPNTARALVDSLLGAFTGYLWEDLGLTGVKKGEREVERFIEGWNGERVREGREVKVIQPRKTGFMSLDFVVPDPGIDVPVGAGDVDVDGNEGEFRDLREALHENGGIGSVL